MRQQMNEEKVYHDNKKTNQTDYHKTMLLYLFTFMHLIHLKTQQGDIRKSRGITMNFILGPGDKKKKKYRE